MPSLDSHSTRTNVRRHLMRWSTWLHVFWPWCLTVNMYDGRRVDQASDKSINEMSIPENVIPPRVYAGIGVKGES